METKSLVYAIVTSRVDYCNSLLYGLPASQLNKVQRVLNTAARLVCCAPRFSDITPMTYELHWPPLKQRIHFKILLFCIQSYPWYSPCKRTLSYSLNSTFTSRFTRTITAKKENTELINADRKPYKKR